MTLKLKTLALALMMTLPVMAIAMDNQDIQTDSAPTSNKRKAEEDPAAASKKRRENIIITLAEADDYYTGRQGSTTIESCAVVLFVDHRSTMSLNGFNCLIEELQKNWIATLALAIQKIHYPTW